jgi:hypothetical protein
MQARAQKVTLPVFQRIQLCDAKDQGAQLFASHAGFNKKLYYRASISTASSYGEGNGNQCNLFPVVTDASGAIWEPALLYLAHRVFDLANCTMATNHNVADDLVHFKRFLDEKNLQFDNFDSPASYELPTYRYRNYLQKQFEQGLLPASSAKRRMHSAIGFYRYLMQKEIISPRNSPWQSKTVKLHLKNSKGFARTQTVETSDLRIKARVQAAPYTDTIDDGGKLRPLPWDHQLLLFKNLMEWSNPEMALIHLIAIFTGARIQTILTLKKSDFPATLASSNTEFRLKVGPGTGVDTKGNKGLLLYFPAWLCERICTYAVSPRAANRRIRATEKEDENCLFLSKFGRPYYDARQKTQKFIPEKTTRYNSNGQEVRKFKAGLIKKIRETDGAASFYYRFHDLRATFGMNLTDAQLQLVREGKITLAQAREYVRFRMGHSSYETTDKYLNYRANLEFIHSVRDSYGSYLHELSNLTVGAQA